MKDEEHVLPLLHKLNRPTFFTRDLGFFHAARRHPGYGLVCLAVNQRDAAAFIRRFLRHPEFNSKAKRLGAVVLVSQEGVRAWRRHRTEEDFLDWSD